MSGYIAKDDLIELLSDMQGRCGTRAELRQNSKIWNQVKDMPTVDAVPVSDVINWLYDYEKEARNLLAIYKASEVVRWMIHDFEVMVLERRNG